MTYSTSSPKDSGALRTTVEENRQLRLFRSLVETIKSRFPYIEGTLDTNRREAEASYEMKNQPGLSFSLHINLQNEDELHINVGSFWCEWFPCFEPGVADQFLDAVCGLLSGNHRIIEFRRGEIPVKALLQKFENDRWETVAKWATWHVPIQWGMKQIIYHNKTEASGSGS